MRHSDCLRILRGIRGILYFSPLPAKAMTDLDRRNGPLPIDLQPCGRPWLRCLAGLLVCAAIAASPALSVLAKQTGEKNPTFFSDAQSHFDKGDFRAAVIQLKNHLRASPSDASARILLGRTYLKLSAGADAEKEFRYAERHGVHKSVIALPFARAFLIQRKFTELLDKYKPDSGRIGDEPDLLAVRGDAQLGLARWAEARKSYDEAIRQAPRAIEPLLGFARLHLALRKSEEASGYVARVLQFEPNNVEARHLSGEIHRRLSRHELAIEQFDRALVSEPNHLAARMGRAIALIELKRFGEARSDVAFARQASPTNPWPNYLLALILTNSGDASGAKSAMADAEAIVSNSKRAISTDHEPTLLAAAVVYTALGRVDDALIYIKRYIKHVPTNVSARKLHARLLLRKGNLSQAIKELKAVEDIAGDDVDFYNIYGMAHIWAKQYDKAMALFEKATTLRPNDPDLQTKLAVGRLATGLVDRAIDGLTAVTRRKKPYKQADLLIGMIHLKNHAYQSAMAAANQVLARAPKNVIALEMAGMAHVGKGEIELARERFGQVIEIAPSYRTVRFRLASLERQMGRLDAATAHYDAILKTDPENTRALYESALIAEQENQAEKALSRLKILVQIDNRHVTARVKIVNLLMRLRRGDEALKTATSFAAAAPGNFKLKFAKARVEFALGNFSTASATLRDSTEPASKLKTGAARALVQVANLLYLARDIEGATETLRQAIARDPKYLPAVEALLKLAIRKGRLDEAEEIVRQYRLARPEPHLEVMLEGDLLAGQGRFAEAALRYEQALVKNRNTSLIIRLFNARQRTGNGLEALQILRSWLRENPGDGVAHRSLAAHLMAFKHYDEATKHHEALLKKSPDDAGLINNLALLYHRNGDTRALVLAKKAYQLAPREPAMLDTYGWLLVLDGQAETGLKYIRDARVRSASDPRIMYHHAVALTRVGRENDAREELLKLIGAHPSFDSIKDARAILKRLSAK